MNKNEYFYQFQQVLDKACEDSKVRKHRIELVDYFQKHWEFGLNTNLTGLNLLQAAKKEICVEKPKGRRKKQ